MSKQIIEIDLSRRSFIHKLHKDLGKYFFSLRAKKNLSLKQIFSRTGMKEERLDRLEIGRANTFDHSAIVALLRYHDVKAYIVFCQGEEFK